jgi:hypothetical protein
MPAAAVTKTAVTKTRLMQTPTMTGEAARQQVLAIYGNHTPP